MTVHRYIDDKHTTKKIPSGKNRRNHVGNSRRSHLFSLFFVLNFQIWKFRKPRQRDQIIPTPTTNVPIVEGKGKVISLSSKQTGRNDTVLSLASRERHTQPPRIEQGTYLKEILNDL